MGSGPSFGLLGPLEVRLDGRGVPVRAGKHRALLAALSLRAGRVVAVNELVAFLWGDDPPARTRGTLQTYVMRLRQLLGDPSLIRTTSDGYRLVVTPEQVDAHRFTTTAGLARQAARQGDPARAADLYAEALDLWRGPALADVPSEALRHEEVPRLTERLMVVHEERNDVELALGNHERLVPVLRGLTTDHPLRERFWAQLMVALYRGSRQAEALEAFRRVDRVLADQLGVEPGAELRRVHQAILVGDPALAAPAEPADPDVPDQLPPDVPGFVGRAEVVDRVARLVAPDETGTAVPIVVLTGVPGVGKTALAVRLAHRLRHRFPDGRLYADLRGHACGPPPAAVDVLTRFLRALGVPPEQIPVDPDEQSSLFRSLLAGRRMLLVLDNAAAPDQVRPLLPGAAGCPVLITSRDDLRGLIAVDGARRVAVDVLAKDEALALLRRTGPAAEELAERCGYLPSTLAIAAAAVGDGPVARYVERLGDRGPAELAHADLPPAARRLFRLLGAVPGPDFTAEAAANAGDLSVGAAGALLARLAAARLLRAHGGRYSFHDEPARSAAGPAEDVAQARIRLLRFYVGAVDQCAELLYPDLMRLPATDGTAVRLPRIETAARARAWLDAERANLTAAIRSAAEHGPAEVSWRLADGLRGYLWIGKHVTEWLTTARYGLDAAHEQRDRAGEAAMRQNLGTLHWRLGDFDTSVAHYTRAVELHRASGDLASEAGVRGALGLVRLDAGDLAGARDDLETCLALHRESGGSRPGETGVLTGLGILAIDTGELAEAEELLGEALAVSTAQGVRAGEITARVLLGMTAQLLGEPRRALTQLAEALRLSRESGFRASTARALEAIASVRLDLGEHSTALALAEQALVELKDDGDQRVTTNVLVVMASANRGRNDLRTADEQFQQALTKARRIGFRFGEAKALVGLAAVRRLRGEPAEAKALCDQAVALTAWQGLRIIEGMARAELAAVHLAMGNHTAAAEEAERANAIRTRTGHRPPPA
ncbi:DNA-binding SARP family transcriptional activator/tetratricopeptide (TPR) repeat protein [Saccharothrix tamanrassetensis]|uniref:DNA-binding SARP family transcriptional activator/tetratricopeptide (TPR) repeat protein n=1 Tax=Saccharothrix tamanrassetensis TaxID=1051531 RepID=A0A841CUA2_9PSEU|nr:BTAD domain-containing putative transcriptional regulator [Saccharothrix tamanrassetensis]MBB5959894.1 DNA-binding SARP family transcriptional activator/tetratricopeptide (TPR) repeat protein [Saccharothrix tamanrassetensis]